ARKRGRLKLFHDLALVEAVLVLRLERHLGKELAHDLLYGVKRSLLLIDGSEYERVLAVTERHGIIEAARNQSSDRGGRLELSWRMTDDLLVGGVARLQIGLGRGQGRQSFRAAGPRPGPAPGRPPPPPPTRPWRPVAPTQPPHALRAPTP